MNVFFTMISVAMIAVFLQNAVFEKALGLNIILYASKSLKNVLLFSLMIVYTMTLSSILVWLVNYVFGDFQYFRIVMPLLYILIVSMVYIISLVVVWLVLPKLFVKIKSYVHLSVFNCSVLGALFLESNFGENLGAYIGYGFGTGVGFLIAGYLLYIAYDRLNSKLVPAAFRGIPIMFVYIGIISLALYAFIGYSTSA